MMNMAMKPIAKSIGVLKRIEPPHSVPIQLKIFTPVGTAISMVVTAKTASASGPMPTANMWCAQTPEAQEADRDAGVDHERRSRRAACARRSAGPRRRCPSPAGSGCRPRGGRRPRTGAARAAGRRRPRARRSACRRSGRTCSRTSATVMTGKARTSRNDVTSVIQTNTGMRMRVMPGARMLMIVTMKLKPPAMRGDAEDLQAEHPEVDAVAGRELLRGQVGVAEPAARRAPPPKRKLEVDEEPAEQEDPVAEGVQPREGDVARADHAAAR